MGPLSTNAIEGAIWNRTYVNVNQLALRGGGSIEDVPPFDR